MYFKPDWEESKKRWEAWWEHELVDRVVVAVTAPRDNPLPHEPVPDIGEDWERKWTDPIYLKLRYEALFAKTYFGGEALPLWWINLGPGIMATYLGVNPVFAESTVWFDQDRIIDDWQQAPEVKVNPENRWWQLTQELARTAIADAAGRYFVGTTDLGGPLDIVASVRGTTELLMDLIDQPELVRDYSRRIVEVWHQYYDILDELIRTKQEGSSAWLGLWCEETWYPIQCDFSAMISPKMFEEFVLPDLEYQCQHLGKSIYHLDGPGEIPHLDLILSIPELTGIQWVPGDGEAPVDDAKWLPLYRRIQAAGKNLVLNGAKPQNIPWLLQELKPEGLYISTSCSSEEEAKRLLQSAAKWTVR